MGERTQSTHVPDSGSKRFGGCRNRLGRDGWVCGAGGGGGTAGATHWSSVVAGRGSTEPGMWVASEAVLQGESSVGG